MFFRSRLAVIPQEPFLFCGTVKENVDPLNEYHDSELMRAIQRCHLTSAVNRLGGLDAQVGHGGRNLSVGQKQLLCLVRAVLHNAKVIVKIKIKLSNILSVCPPHSPALSYSPFIPLLSHPCPLSFYILSLFFPLGNPAISQEGLDSV